MTVSEPLLLTASETARLLGVSRSKFWELASRGRIPLPIRFSPRCPRWPRDELERWIRAGCPNRSIWELQRRARA